MVLKPEKQAKAEKSASNNFEGYRNKPKKIRLETDQHLYADVRKLVPKAVSAALKDENRKNQSPVTGNGKAEM